MPDQLEAVAEEVVQCAEQCQNDFSIEISLFTKEFISNMLLITPPQDNKK